MCYCPVLFYTFDRHSPPSVERLEIVWRSSVDRLVKLSHVFTQTFSEPGPAVLHAYTTPNRLRVTCFEISGLNGVNVSVNGCM